MKKNHEKEEEKVEESKETVAGTIAAVAFLIFACAMFGFLLVASVEGVHGWWTKPEAITFDVFIERMDACNERELGVEWIANADGTYKYVTCKGE